MTTKAGFVAMYLSTRCTRERHQNFFLIILLFFILGSCRQDKVAAIGPFNIGDTFVMKSTYYEADPDSVTIDTIRIVSKYSSGEDICYSTNSPLDRLIQRPNGLWTKVLFSEPHQYILYPAEVGDVYGQEVFARESGDTLVGEWTVIATDTSITVQAGTFNCNGYLREYRKKGQPISREWMWWTPKLLQFVLFEEYGISPDGQEYLVRREELVELKRSSYGQKS
jgi:hypothetical protein